MKKYQQGLIIQIVIVIIALISLGFYFKLDLVGFFQKQEVRDFFIGAWGYIKIIWHYVKIGFTYIVSLF